MLGSLFDLELPAAVGVTAVGEALNDTADPRVGDAAFEALVHRVWTALSPGGTFLFDASLHGRSGADRRRVQFHDRRGWSLGMVETEDEASLTREITTFSKLASGWLAVVARRR